MCSLCRLLVAKKPLFWQILTFWGLLHRTTFTNEGQMLCAIPDPRYMLTCTNFVLIGLFCHPLLVKNPIFAVFGLRHLVLSQIGNSLTKLNKGAQPQSFTYLTASQSFLYSNAFMAKSGAQCLTIKIVRNKQTDRQTDKKLNVFGTPAAGEIRAPPNLAW